MRNSCSVPAVLLLLVAASASAQQPPSSITGTRVECSEGSADDYGCDSVDLLSFVSLEDMDADYANDIWGWTDPETEKEYALVGLYDAVAFVDVSDPVEPVHVGSLPSYDSNARAIWRDMKVYEDHVFVVVDGSGNNGMQVFDLTELRSADGDPPVSFEESARYGGIRTAHNIAINEDTGFAYLVGSSSNGHPCGRGLHMVDIQDPLDPTYAGCFKDDQTGNGGNGYTHDVQCVTYHGPDENYSGREICIGSNVNAISIADVTDKDDPVAVAILKYPNAAYAHQGWLTPDHSYFLLNDEADETSYDLGGTRTVITDLLVLDDPVTIDPFINPVGTIDHNLYVSGDYVFQANYTSGLRILDISDIYDPSEVGFFDTVPEHDFVTFDGAWSVYPFFQSGIVIVSDSELGLFVLEPIDMDFITAGEAAEEVPDAFVLSGAHPDPFNPSTSLTLSLPDAQSVRVAAYDITGREVALLHDGFLSAGDHVLRFEAGHLSSGTYIVRAATASALQASTVTLVK